MSPLEAAGATLVWVGVRGSGALASGVGGAGSNRSGRNGQQRLEQGAALEAVNLIGDKFGLPVKLEARQPVDNLAR